MTTPSDRPIDKSRQPSSLQVRAEKQEFTLEHFMGGLTVQGVPIRGYSSRVLDSMREVYELSWDFWPPTIWVTQILLATQAAAGSNPPQTVTTSVSVSAMGFRPSVAVKLKWNNAWDFPGFSVPLPDGVPDSHGRFALVLHHTTVPRRGPTWYWEQNNQLVLVAQQHAADGSIENYSDYRPVPPHVLFQWIP